MYCKKCGQQLDDDSTFCTCCGTNLGSVEVLQQNQIKQPTHNINTRLLVGIILLVLGAVVTIFGMINGQEGFQKASYNRITGEMYNSAQHTGGVIMFLLGILIAIIGFVYIIRGIMKKKQK